MTFNDGRDSYASRYMYSSLPLVAELHWFAIP